jgi:hypothetical protein
MKKARFIKENIIFDWKIGDVVDIKNNNVTCMTNAYDSKIMGYPLPVGLLRSLGLIEIIEEEKPLFYEPKEGETTHYTEIRKTAAYLVEHQGGGSVINSGGDYFPTAELRDKDRKMTIARRKLQAIVAKYNEGKEWRIQNRVGGIRLECWYVTYELKVGRKWMEKAQGISSFWFKANLDLVESLEKHRDLWNTYLGFEV